MTRAAGGVSVPRLDARIQEWEAVLRYRLRRDSGAKELAQAERALGRTLSSTLRRRCREYAREVFGSERYSPWLAVYTLVRGEFREGWIPDNYYREYVMPSQNGSYGRLSRLRGVQQMVFAEDAFPDLLYAVNGLLVTPGREVVTLSDALDRLFARTDAIVFKEDDSKQGTSVYFLERTSAKALLERPRRWNGVFQSVVTPHAALAAFHQGSVATMRLTTVVGPTGEPSLRAAYLRFATGVETHIHGATSMRVAIAMQGGALFDQGYSQTWQRLDRHPTSGKVFSGVTVPAFDEAVGLVLRCHRRVPYIQCIGWDVTVDPSERPVLLEWEAAHNAIIFTEATQGPCFTDLGWERLWR